MQKTAQAHSIDPPRGRLFGVLRFSSVELLISLALMFLAAPFIEGLPGGEYIDASLITMVMLSAVLAVRAQRRTLFLAALLVVPAVAGKWLNHLRPQGFPPTIYLVGAIVFFIFVFVNLLRFILRTPRVNTEVLCASVSGYLMLGLLWTMGYRLAVFVTPGAFAFNATPMAAPQMSGFTAFYFSFVTLSTLGYGDITPVSNLARMLAVMESTTGTLYVAILIARLVSLYSAAVPSVEPIEPEQPDQSAP
jgi:voltage-gated potassium channel